MKFDIRDFLIEQDGEELEKQDQEQDQAQGQGQQGPDQQQIPQQPQTGEEESPVQDSAQDVSDQVFADIKGKTVKDVSFTRPGTNAGKIEVYFADQQIPMVISWVNDKVTVTKPPGGEPYPLT